MRHFAYLFLVLSLSLALSLQVFAQEEGPSVSKKERNNAAKRDYVQGNLKNFSRLYWAMNMLDMTNDEHIDNFMLINECDLYTDYFSNEFEWRTVRKSTRNFIRENIGEFPLYFEFMQPLKLGEYDFKMGSFTILPDYKIENMRRFEVMVPGSEIQKICGRSGMIEGYPKALLLEFNRPLHLVELPVKEELAKAYITNTVGALKKMKQELQNKKNLYDRRDAYLVFKAKIVTFRGIDLGGEGYKRAKFVAILEGFDVYADQGKEMLLYTENLGRRKKTILFEGAEEDARNKGSSVKGRLAAPESPEEGGAE